MIDNQHGLLETLMNTKIIIKITLDLKPLIILVSHSV